LGTQVARGRGASEPIREEKMPGVFVDRRIGEGQTYDQEQADGQRQR